MPHTMVAVVIVVVLAASVASFLLGRASMKVLRDRELEAKRSRLMKMRDELLEMTDGLIQREADLRAQWQAMVVNASEFEAQLNGANDSWTDSDDRFLESWSSAERVVESGE